MVFGERLWCRRNFAGRADGEGRDRRRVWQVGEEGLLRGRVWLFMDILYMELAGILNVQRWTYDVFVVRKGGKSSPQCRR